MVAMAVVAVYLASYRALVSRDIMVNSDRYPTQVHESYGHAPRLCGYLFAPANRLDRALRPRYWATPACVY
jgi:hypothetical protein